jgi:hypothetical protein
MGAVFTNALATGSPRRTSNRQAFHVVIIACTIVLLVGPKTIVLVVAAIFMLVRFGFLCYRNKDWVHVGGCAAVRFVFYKNRTRSER